jgi:hypothetical protein
MNDETQVNWRKALQTKGKDWVLNHLRSRPSQPGDTIYDVVFEAPFPTREFCQRWCADEDNKLFNLSGHTIALLVALVIAVICAGRAVHSWHAQNIGQTFEASITGGGMPGKTASMSDSASADSFDPSTNNNTVSNSDNLPSVCAYITYQTAQCNGQANSDPRRRVGPEN